MTLDELTRLQQRCIRALDDFGALPAIKKFCLAVVEYEEETSDATLRMHEKLQKLNPDSVDSLETFRELVQGMTHDFKTWNQTVDALVISGSSLPPLQATRLQNKRIRAPSSIQTKQLQIEEGDDLVVTDVSQPNVIKVRTQDGKEDYVPLLVCFLPSNDKTVSSLLQRLFVQLLSSWTDCLSQSGKLLLRATTKALQTLKLSKSDLAGLEMNGSSIISRLRKLHDFVEELETELPKASTTSKVLYKDTVSGLLQTLNCYQLFYEYWNNFRLQLRGRKPRPICIFEKLADFKNHVSNNNQVRCYQTTFTVESTEICEETVHLPMGDMDDDASSYGGGGSWKQEIATEQLTSTSQEEKKRYVIRSVKDPRSGAKISLKEAIEFGIMNMKQGLYVNPDTKETKAITVALADDHIQVDYVTNTRSTPRTEALGLITIRDRIESRKYTITAVIDATTAERVDLSEAKKRGIVDENATSFVITTSGETIAMDDAVESGWVIVEYESDEGAVDESEVRSRTYAIRAVVDQRLKKRVPFIEAVQRKLVDRDSGNYYNNLTGETVHVMEAMRRGFLKAKLIDDPTKLDIDPTNKMVVEGIKNLRHMVTGLGALSALKECVNRSSTSSTGSI